MVNIMMTYKFSPPGLYHGLITVKLVLGLVIFFIASTLVGRSANAEKFREKAVFWLNVNLVLALAVVLIGGFLKVQPRVRKSAEQAARSQLQAPLEAAFQPKFSSRR
jgi:hypothetical protein